MELEHPVIRNMEKTGYPDGKTPKVPICPVCHNVCDTVYVDQNQEIIGCDECLTAKDAWDIESIQGYES